MLLSWGEETGYWYPPLLVDDIDSPARYVSVEQVSESEGPSGGMVRTSPAVFDFAVGEYGHMLHTVQHHIDRKTAKRQMENAPGLKWLFVVIDDNMAAVKLDDCFGPDALKPYPYDLLDGITFDYFDEVWVTGRSFHDRHHVVLRLFKTGDAPQHKIVRRAEVLAG